MKDPNANDFDGISPPLTPLRPEVQRRFEAHDREARGYARRPPAESAKQDD